MTDLAVCDTILELEEDAETRGLVAADVIGKAYPRVVPSIGCSGQEMDRSEPVEVMEIKEGRNKGAESDVVFKSFRFLRLAGGGYLSMEAVSAGVYGDTLGAWWASEIYGSLRGTYGWWERMMLLHVASSVIFWCTGALQIWGKSLRRVQGGWIHRLVGYVCFGVFFLAVAPTSAYLSLFLGVGNLSGLQTIVFLDTVAISWFYMWRALQVIRVRRNGAASVRIHARLVQAGILLSATILVQRGALMGVYGVRLAAWVVGENISALQTTVEAWLPSHDTCVTISVVAPAAVFFFLLDYLDSGPRSLGSLFLDQDEIEEGLGPPPPIWERWAWRLRLPFYFCLRALVTKGFQAPPPHF
eukprot:gnl/MRDRNA2_/MRDRNA2_190132_c0_seq1.p1 gnl/MRDRNA2_/MRDRNA2_190132_c0~~gnl/MRDRNA2_/MRDRNA2_190132_c0_seq1.p1  ORF type:complete len:357 (-),score=43.13 gnl/MRDRNA2_/MRDRNA2_190132_c0_seq1:5-1075(-)